MTLEPEPLFAAATLFHDRRDGGRRLAAALEDERNPQLVVVGLARGGVVTAAEVAEALDAPLDVVAVRKIGHPWQPEYALGAAAPGGGVYVRSSDGLTSTRSPRSSRRRRPTRPHPSGSSTGSIRRSTSTARPLSSSTTDSPPAPR